jgi:hypothetical protein
VKYRDVRTYGKLDHELAIVGCVVVVLHQPLANLTRSDADDRVCVGVVGGGAVEDFYADASFFQPGRVTFEGLLYGVGEEGGIALAVAKQGVGEEALQLLADRGRGGNGNGAAAGRRIFLAGFWTDWHPFLTPQCVSYVPR